MGGTCHEEIAERTIDRRRFLKTSAAAGAVAAASPLFAPAVHAQNAKLKLGYVTPQSGPLAAFAASDDFNIKGFMEATKGVVEAGGSTFDLEVVVKDSQSNPNRAAEVAKELIVDDEIDLMLVASTPETTNPVSTQCEIEQMPNISTMAPWQPWFIGRQADPAGGPPAWKPFDYTFHYFWGLEDIIAVFLNMWNQLDTNKVVGGLFPNDGDGNAWGDPVNGVPPAFKAAGYETIDPGRYQNLTDDFSAQITAFKNAGAEIVTGVVLPPDFTTFWNQANQQGFKPKAVSVGKAILFPESVEVLGRGRQQPFVGSLVVAEPSLQVVAHRPVGRRARGRLRGGGGPAMDAADRLHPFAVRGRGRRAEARRGSEGPAGAARLDRRDRPRRPSSAR